MLRKWISKRDSRQLALLPVAPQRARVSTTTLTGLFRCTVRLLPNEPIHFLNIYMVRRNCPLIFMLLTFVCHSNFISSSCCLHFIFIPVPFHFHVVYMSLHLGFISCSCWLHFNIIPVSFHFHVAYIPFRCQFHLIFMLLTFRVYSRNAKVRNAKNVFGLLDQRTSSIIYIYIYI